MSQQTVKYIEGWKALHPDFIFKCWSEDNFKIDNAPLYVQQAYVKRKYAFVSDYVRLWALYREGGIYLDTDVEVLKTFSSLLDLHSFIGFEANKACTVETAIIGSEPGLLWIKEILAYYKNRPFVLEDGSLDMTANPTIFSRIFETNGLIPNGQMQIYKEILHVFPVDYFAPLSSTRILRVTENTYCIHHFDSSWRQRSKSELICNFIIDKILGRALIDKLIQLKRKISKKIK